MTDNHVGGFPIYCQTPWESLDGSSFGKAEAVLLVSKDGLSRLERYEAVERVQVLLRAGRLEAARSECMQLVWDFPAMGTFRFLLARVEDDLGNVESSLHHARVAVELAPTAETASAQLVLSLRKAGRLQEEVEEIVRFLKLTGRRIVDCRLHSDLVAETRERLQEHEEHRDLCRSFEARLEELEQRNSLGSRKGQ